MSEPVPPATDPAEPGAPIARGSIDPDLIKLSRSRMRIGIITAAGIVFLCAAFLLRIGADRRFAGNDAPTPVTVEDVLANKIDVDRYVSLPTEVVIGNAVRAISAKGDSGLRVVPARGTGDRLWIVLTGNGFAPATTTSYTGRLRRLADLPFHDAVIEYLAAHPRPLFARGTAVRAGLAAGKVDTLEGKAVTPAATDHVAFDVVDPNAATVIASLGTGTGDKLSSVAAWTAALWDAGLTPGKPIPVTDSQLRFDIVQPDALAAVTAKLADPATGLGGLAHVEPVRHHYDTTWGALRASPAGAIAVPGGATVPDAELDLVGLYVTTAVPADAYALISGDRPDQYSFVMPITIALVVIGLLFAWALVRAIRRDVLPPRAV